MKAAQNVPLTEVTKMNKPELIETILTDLRAIAKGGVTQATAYADLRDNVPLLFPAAPTMAQIDEVKKSEDWRRFDSEARLIFATAYFNAPRVIGERTYDKHDDAFRFECYSADKKTAAQFDDTASKIREASMAYVRVAMRQNVTKLIPKAIDAPEADETETEKLPDPTGTLALVAEALTILSEKSPDGALALLNGLDALVKHSRPYITKREPIPRKA